MRQLSPTAERLLRFARQRYPDPLRVAGIVEQAAVRELVESNVVAERDVDTRVGYSARIVATPWERRA
jgi:hypothetical protein